jgi:hypothetical protein
MAALADACADRALGHAPRHVRLRSSARVPLWLACQALVWFAAAPAPAYTPESPEVVAMVDKALAYLDRNTDSRLGGKCLIALAFHKNGASPSHHRITEAVEACRTSLESEVGVDWLYSKAIAIIFLTELDPKQYGDLIRKYVELLPAHQKEHGGFGYYGQPTGDTSQTQYTALAYWEMLNNGIAPDADAVQKCLNWLLRTQDPTGLWGYQGIDPGSETLVAQTDRPGASMAAAGLSSALILGNAVGLLTAEGRGLEGTAATTVVDNLPAALKQVEQQTTARVPVLPAGNVDPKRLAACVARGRGWWDKNFVITISEFPHYYLYSIERMKSFEGYLHGEEEEEPKWYDAGVEWLRSSQSADGSWYDGSTGQEVATAFSVLFLLRSTQQTIKARLGEGTLVGGRGLPRDLSKVRLRGGRLVVQQTPTELDQLLELMEEGEGGDLDALIDNPAALEVGEVTPEAARRLQQAVRGGPPETRRLAVRALGRARNLDFVPTLIFALTDPDRAVVREARDALQSVSRQFEGFGPPDNFDEDGRARAIVRWKAWYASVRPDAPPLPD